MTRPSTSDKSASRDGAKLPRYERIAEALRDQIRSELDPGDFLDPEPVLAERFGVNRHTVRRAIDELIADGLLWRQQGRGTLVLRPPIDYRIHADTRFTETVTSLGHSARSIVVGRRVTPAGSGVGKRLGIEAHVPVVQFDTLRLINDHPTSLASHFLPSVPFESVYLEYDGGSLHAMLRERFGVELKRAESLITARFPREDDAMALRMSPREPILRIKSLNVDAETGRATEYVISRFRADGVQLKVEP